MGGLDHGGSWEGWTKIVHGTVGPQWFMASWDSWTTLGTVGPRWFTEELVGTTGMLWNGIAHKMQKKLYGASDS